MTATEEKRREREADPYRAPNKRRLRGGELALRWILLILAAIPTVVGIVLWMPPLWLVAIALWVVFGLVVLLQKAPRGATVTRR